MPEFVSVSNKANGETILPRARWCSSFLCRLRGLTFRRRIAATDSLVLVERTDSKSATSIHMFFVFFSIAAIWIDSNGQIVDKHVARPFRPIYVPDKPARYVLETPPELFGQFNIGDQIEFHPSRS